MTFTPDMFPVESLLRDARRARADLRENIRAACTQLAVVEAQVAALERLLTGDDAA